MKLFLDDEREAPNGWTRVKTPKEAIDRLQTQTVTEISLDHDLGIDDNNTGYTVICWIEEQVFINNFEPPKIHIHTANSSAYIKMAMCLSRIEAYLKLHE